jgi:hypothetical protein
VKSARAGARRATPYPAPGKSPSPDTIDRNPERRTQGIGGERRGGVEPGTGHAGSRNGAAPGTGPRQDPLPGLAVIGNPLRPFSAYAELLENLKQWYAEPPTVEHMTVISSYRLF